MPHLLFADNFLAGSLLTIVLPLGLLIAVTIWYVVAIRQVPDEPPVSTRLPPPEILDAAGPDVIGDVTPTDPSSPAPDE